MAYFADEPPPPSIFGTPFASKCPSKSVTFMTCCRGGTTQQCPPGMEASLLVKLVYQTVSIFCLAHWHAKRAILKQKETRPHLGEQ